MVNYHSSRFKMEQITIELPTPIIKALTAYTQGQHLSSSETIKTALESFLTAKGYLSQPKKPFLLSSVPEDSGYADTSILSAQSSNSSTVETLDQKLKGRVGRVNFQPSDLSERVGEAFSELLKDQKSDLNQ